VIVGYTDPERTPRSEQLDNSESINRACADMKLFNQEVLAGTIVFSMTSQGPFPPLR
jgi:hypothetical protein